MRSTITIIGLYLTVSLPVFCQLDSILSIKDHAERHASFINYIEDNYQPFEAYDSILRAAEIKINKLNDDKLKQEIWFYNQDRKSRTYNGPTLLSSMTPLIEAVEQARKKSWTYIEAKLCARIGNFYHAQGQTQAGFEYLVKALDLVNQLDINKYPEILKIIDNVAVNYYTFGDYVTALSLFKKGMGVATYWRNKSERYILTNTIGLCYQKQLQYDTAIYYFELAHQNAREMGNEFWATLTMGNRAYCHYLAGNYDEALPPLLKDFELSAQWGEVGSAVNAAMIIAAIYVEKNNLTEAAKYLEYGIKHQSFLDARQKISYYTSLNQISRQKGDYRQAISYLDSVQKYKDIAAITNNDGIIRNAELKLYLEKHKYDLELLDSEKSRQITLRNAVLVIICLLGIIAGLWSFNIHLKRKRALELAEQAKVDAFRELEQAKKELNNFTAVIKEKNELIQSVKSELSALEHSNHGEERIKNINELLNSSILTEDDWREFKSLFDRVYPGFFIRLQEKLPHLTQAEVRLFALLKLNMNQKDMAFMLGVGYDAIRKVKQRLNAKISGQNEITLDEIVNSI